MQANQRTTVVGVFEDRRRADEAVDALRSAGFRDEQIGVVMPRDESWGDSVTTETAEDDTHAWSGRASPSTRPSTTRASSSRAGRS